MRRIIFLALFVTILIGGVYGQTRSENRWLVGNWVQDNEVVFTFGNDGSVRLPAIWNFSGYFSIRLVNNDLYEIRIFHVNGGTFLNVTLHRINDNRFEYAGGIYNKRN